jgi:hypothetical protein
VRLRSRNAMISAEGILCMLEQIAHEQPREVTERVAMVCQRLFEIHAEAIGRATPLNFSKRRRCTDWQMSCLKLRIR